MREQLYIPGSTKAGVGYLMPDALRNEGVVRYHTEECTYHDSVMSTPFILWEHPSVGRYVINPRTFSRHEAAHCKYCERLASGWKKLTKTERSRRWRAAKALREGRTVRAYTRRDKTVSDAVL